MESTDIITYTEFGFDAELYKNLQQQAILERISHFKKGTLYLEIGGKFLYDPHAARVLPGFNPKAKLEIINELSVDFEAIFCVNARDIQQNRMLSSKNISYIDSTIAMIEEYQKALRIPIAISITMVTDDNLEAANQYIQTLREKGYICYKHFVIENYPFSEKILTSEGYGKDQYIPHEAPLVLVLGAASNSGKMSTCLSQLYHDTEQGIESGYAKYELFPIWNLPLNHPVNLAYEAATVDIGDYNLVDPFHLKAHGISAVNYNRDVDAFPIVQHLANQIIASENYMRTYKSPTDMGLNKAGFAITDDKIVCETAIAEIFRRKEWLAKQVKEGRGENEWLVRMEEVASKLVG
jgi:uncharacterized protein (UPF0371 family)